MEFSAQQVYLAFVGTEKGGRTIAQARRKCAFGVLSRINREKGGAELGPDGGFVTANGYRTKSSRAGETNSGGIVKSPPGPEPPTGAIAYPPLATRCRWHPK
jgi:hypothetical protein